LRQLDIDYTAEIDHISADEWNEALPLFADASFYQTWSFGAIHTGSRKMSHIVVKKNGRVVSLGQVRIIKVPFLHVGLAHITWGPLWKIDGDSNTDHLRNSLRALYNEYVVRRGLFLRIVPPLADNRENEPVKSVFSEEGYSRVEHPVQTVFLDLTPTIGEIRQNLSRSWRHTLQAAERRGMHFVEGSDDRLCEMAIKLVREMRDRKQFYGGNQLEAITVHRYLPESLKLRFLVCLDGDEPIAVLGWQTFGNMGLPLVGAAGNGALKKGSSNLLWWKMLEYYKTHGFTAVDVGGVNEKQNPGGYFFKTHLKGKLFNGPESYIGQFDAYQNPASCSLFRIINGTRQAYRDLRRGMAATIRRTPPPGEHSGQTEKPDTSTNPES
jgi:hypothetical protein